MRLSYQLSLSDYLAAQHLHYQRKFSGKLILALNYVVFPLLGFLGLGLYLLSHISHPERPWSAGFFPAIVVLMLLPLWFQFNLRRSYKKSRVIDGDCIFEITDEDIKTEMPGYAKSTIEWQAVRQVTAGTKTILVYVAPTRFMVIPERILEKDQREELLNLIERHIVRKKI